VICIYRGRTSILVRLKEQGIEASEYISFHSLRNHSILNNTLITELIYVHSKLLIADDRVVICGSANINDRSMIGKRDSEIAAILKDEHFEESRMNGKKYRSGVFAGRLRKYLFKEHLGLLDPDAERQSIDITDPVVDQFWHGTWRRISNRNTEIYDEVFKCIPTNNIRTFANLRKYQEDPPLCKSDPEIATKRITNIQVSVDFLLVIVCLTGFFLLFLGIPCEFAFGFSGQRSSNTTEYIKRRTHTYLGMDLNDR